MNRVGKIVPPKRVILKDISLSFFPGRQDRRAGPERLRQVEPAAHHGGRGQGVRRRSGADAEHAHRLPAAGAAARPRQDRARDGRGGPGRDPRREDRGSTRSTPRTPSPTPTSTSSPPSRRSTRRSSRRPARTPTLQMEIAADALRLPPWDAKIAQALGRREAPRRAVPPAAVEARHAAAGRADQPPRRRERRLAGAVPAALPGHRDRGDARPLLPRQRRRVDPRARPRLRHSVEGQLQLVAGAEGSAAARPRRSRRPRASRRCRRSWSGCAQNPKGRQAKSKARIARFEELVVLRAPEAQRDAGDLHSGRRAPRRRGHRVQGREQGLRRPPADRQPVVPASRRARSSASSGRTAPASRRCSG